MWTMLLITGMLMMGRGPQFRVLFENPELAEKIGLSDSQLDSLRNLYFSTEEDIVSLRGQLELKKLKLRQLMESENPDEREVLKIADGIEKLRGEIHKKRLESHLKARKIMTQEKWLKWRKLERQRRYLSRENRHRDIPALKRHTQRRRPGVF